MLSRVLTSTSSTLNRSRQRITCTWVTAPTTTASSSSSTSTSLFPSSLCTCSVSSSFSSSLPSSSSSFSSSSRSFSTATSSSSSSPITSKPRLISLSNISDNKGARTKRTRVGRGPGSGLGKTAGRGHKGTWARRSLAKPGFEGGQTPLHRTMPKRGFTNIFATPPAVVDLKRVQMWIDQGRIRADQLITIKTLWDSGCVTKVQYGIKILSHGGQLKQPIHLEVTDVSSKAKEAIDAAGGSVKLVYFNRVGLRHHLKPEKFAPGFEPPGESSIPPPKKQARYALQGVRPVVLRQTAAQIALANLKAAAEAEAKKGAAGGKTTSTTPTPTPKSDAKKEKKEKKAATAAAATTATAQA